MNTMIRFTDQTSKRPTFKRPDDEIWQAKKRYDDTDDGTGQPRSVQLG